ncbi:MAG: biotin--[acetyl-CoA-carboxylase] ligase [Anaerolineales bacterium]|jgi:BirA family biotin operon repressor/biotin-[acetyl-CoA-carboxylase] ligase
MDQQTLQVQLKDLPLGSVGYFPVLESTNTEALRRIEDGAPHLSLIVADEQTSGRGRRGRKWYTLPGSALAFSLILRAEESRPISASRLTGIGALAVCDTLQNIYDLPAKIKWPNDVLVFGSKLAGVLVEAQWQGDKVSSAVVGIGINVARKSVPSQGDLDLPATSVETAAGKPVDRWKLLRQVLLSFLERMPQLELDEFIQSWEAYLAYRGQMVQLIEEGVEPITGLLLGLNREGLLRLKLPGEEMLIFQAGDLKLRQVDRS